MLKLENEKLRREYSDDVKNYNGDFEKKLLSFEESYRQLNYKKEESDKVRFHCFIFLIFFLFLLFFIFSILLLSLLRP